MYEKIREHPTVREIFARRLVEDGVLTQEQVDQQAEEAYARVAEAHKRVKANVNAELDDQNNEKQLPGPRDAALDTAVAAATLRALNDELLVFPEGFTPHTKLRRQMERRRASLADGSIDWGTAESLAFASLLLDGHPIRLSGQDTERGTFSQRHVVFHDERTGKRWIPMQHLNGAVAAFEVYNSPLSEVGCLGFEYGYSAADPNALVIWEAQYGDFTNNAQMVVDQFISAGRAKWGQRSRLTLLLPHGYEGSGPEHSSARLERFLMLSADANMRVANCTTSAQYFHLLRGQGLLIDPRPLIVMTPKSLLRLKEAAATLAELSEGLFQTVVDDPVASQDREAIRTLIFCSGRIYYDLELHPRRRDARDLAIARVEQLHPVPADAIHAVVASYPNLEHITWVQEEPENMGAWWHIEHCVRQRVAGRPWEYVGRPPRASPSEGYAGSHRVEQERIVIDALNRSGAFRASTAEAPAARS
jgi:2-oxoglutarate dehydrogenase complex dehydrogenase (E1) component-like enzyme